MDKPLADPGLTSYRYLSRYGWVMIEAKDTLDALHEAGRSISEPISPVLLEVWTGTEYAPVTTTTTTTTTEE